jgi:hypothetical protein
LDSAFLASACFFALAIFFHRVRKGGVFLQFCQVKLRLQVKPVLEGVSKIFGKPDRNIERNSRFPG